MRDALALAVTVASGDCVGEIDGDRVAEAVCVVLAAELTDSDGESVTLAEPDRDAVRDALPLAVTDAAGDCVGLNDGVLDADAVVVALPDALPLALADADGDDETVGVAAAELEVLPLAATERDAVGETDTVAAGDAVRVALAEPLTDVDAAGVCDATTERDGVADGTTDADADALGDALAETDCDRDIDALALRDADGEPDGDALRLDVGDNDPDCVGDGCRDALPLEVAVAAALRLGDADDDGDEDGDEVLERESEADAVTAALPVTDGVFEAEADAEIDDDGARVADCDDVGVKLGGGRDRETVVVHVRDAVAAADALADVDAERDEEPVVDAETVALPLEERVWVMAAGLEVAVALTLREAEADAEREADDEALEDGVCGMHELRTIEPADPVPPPLALGPVPTHVYVTVVPAMAAGLM